ncbi:MAG TPA: hypothetical protein VIH88_10015 [Candidatus Acidoferrales bacterium]
MRTDSSLHWKDIFLHAMEESDKEKLHRLVRDAELAIFLRREELGNSAHAREELSTMAVAIEALRSIRVHQLGGDKSNASSDGGSIAGTAEQN